MTELLVAVAIGAALFVILSWMRARNPQHQPAATIQDPSARFHALSATLSEVGESSSHPRDLASNETFREAVALLASADAPLSVVTDYAAGANWMPSTVACAALCERSDREGAAALMAGHFRHLPRTRREGPPKRAACSRRRSSTTCGSRISGTSPGASACCRSMP